MTDQFLDTTLCTYMREQQDVLWRDPAAAQALSVACAATLTAFSGPSDGRLWGGVVHVNGGFAADPRFVFIGKPQQPFYQGVVLYTFPTHRKKGYASGVLRYVQDILGGAQVPFQAPVRAVDDARLRPFYERLDFQSAPAPTTDANGEAFFDYFWHVRPFRVFISAAGKPSIEMLRGA